MVVKSPHDYRQNEPNYEDLVLLFEQEGRNLVKFSDRQHPNIVKVLDFFYEISVPCIVMDYLDGQTLEAVVVEAKTKNQVIPEETIVHWIVTIGEALDRVHELGLVHRNVTPENIIINQDSQAFLIGFGLALEIQPHATTTIADFAGHRDFSPLEQLTPNNENPDCIAARNSQLDMYSLAATLYFAMTGEVPKGAFDRIISINRKNKDSLIPPQTMAPTISDRIHHAILAGMEMDADDRPAAMKDWIRLLNTPLPVLTSVQLPINPIELADQAELNSLVNAIALNDRTLAVFAIAPNSSPQHPVVQEFQTQLTEQWGEPVQFSTLHYSDDSVFRFLGRFEGEERLPGRQVVMIFGLEQLPAPRLKQEMEQLNLGRERIFSYDLVLVFWLNREAFLDEFRRRAADFWDWRGNVVTFVTCPPTELLLYPYLEWLIAENSYLKMSGVMQVNRQVDISLDQIYVSLQAEWVEEKSQSFRERVSPGVGRSRSRRASEMGEPDGFEEEFRDEPLMEMSVEPARPQRVTKMMDVAEAVRQREYGGILGDPGAGKTTLLRYLARHFAIAHREGRSTVTGGMGEDLGGARLPILFRIADFAEKRRVEPELGLVEYLRRFYWQWEGGGGADEGDAVARLLLSKMATGDCLLLLDGLDEVLDGENRGRVVRAIDRLVSEYSSNKFVITSRIAGYQEASLGSRFREFTITPMGNEQIKSFLGRWCLAIEVAQRPEAETSLHERDATREASGIFHAIETKPGVKRFAANPLLLTILALIHRNGTQMPQRRVELYALATKTLIEDWQLGRNVAYGAQAKPLMLVEEEVTALLAPLAFRMHDEKSSGVVTQGEVEEWLMPWMAELQGVDDGAALGLVQEFLRKVRETTGLFVERGPGVYGFMHLTFEEYYAARHIANNDVPDILEMIQPYLYEARWNEPILLALGYLSTDQKRVNRLLEKMFESLATYQPIVVGQEIRLKNATSDPALVWRSETEGEAQESAAVWKDLLFVGQILAEVKVAPKFCRQQVDKLVLTYVGLDEGFGNDAIQQLFRLFRGIESFNGQVLERLQKSAFDEQLSEEQRDRIVSAILYVSSGESDKRFD